MTRRTLWLVGIAIILAILCIRIERIHHPSAADTSPEPMRGPAAKSAHPLADILAPMPDNERGEVDPSALPRVRLEGIAITAKQEPIAGATIHLGEHTTVSESDGSFAFDDVPQDVVIITAERGDLYGEARSHLSEDSEPVEVTMRAGPTLTVHVMADKTGAPIVGAKVETDDREAITDATGTARLRGIESQDEVLWVSAPGFADYRDRVVGDESQPLAPIETTVRMESGSPIRGYVVGPKGERIPEARVRISAETHTVAVYADDQGTFEIPDAPAGLLQITATADNYLRDVEQQIEHDGVHPLEGVRVTVIEGCELAGIVVDENGAPVEGASISGASTDNTGPDGRFLARGLEEGSLEVRAYLDDRSSATAVVEVSLKRRADVRFVLVRTAISGVVVGRSGEPIADATVYATKDDDSLSAAIANTDEYGKFTLNGLPPGDYDLRAQFAEEINRPMPVTTGQRVHTGRSGVRIVLQPLATVRGRVVLDGAPVPYFGVSIMPPDSYGERTTITNDPSGAFSQDNLAAGTYKVTLAGPDFDTWTRDITVTAGSTLDLGNIAVTRGRIVRGRVTDSFGAPIAGATVIAGVTVGYLDASKVNQRMSGTTTAVTDATGAYALVGVPREESLAIGAKLPNGRDALEQRLEPTDTVVDLVVPEVGSLDGIVTTRSRDRLFLYSREITFSALIDVDAAGIFRLLNVPAGVYELGPSGRSEEFITVTITANRTTTVSYTPTLVPDPEAEARDALRDAH